MLLKYQGLMITIIEQGNFSFHNEAIRPQTLLLENSTHRVTNKGCHLPHTPCLLVDTAVDIYLLISRHLFNTQERLDIASANNG